MIDLPIGTRFYYNGELCEVSVEQCWHCAECAFTDDFASCRMFACEQAARQDKVGVFAKRAGEGLKSLKK